MRNAELEKRIAARPTGEGSFATGLKQGATFGFADELAGAFGALGSRAARHRGGLRLRIGDGTCH